MEKFCTVFVAAFMLGLAGVFWGCEEPGEAEMPPPEEEAVAEDTVEAGAVVEEPIMPVSSSMVNYGEEFFGLFAEPEDPAQAAEEQGLDPEAPLPGLLAVHHSYGLDDVMRGEARRLAGEGFQVLAVDLFDAETAQTEEEAAGLVELAQLDMTLMLQSLENAHDYMVEERQVEQLGIVGWSFGGASAFQALANWPESFDAAVIIYGDTEGVSTADLDGFDGPVLIIIGEQDEVVEPGSALVFEEEFTDAGYEVEILEREGVGHDFANPLSERYDEEAARWAYDEAVRFLQEHLYQAPVEELDEEGLVGP